MACAETEALLEKTIFEPSPRVAVSNQIALGQSSVELLFGPIAETHFSYFLLAQKPAAAKASLNT